MSPYYEYTVIIKQKLGHSWEIINERGDVLKKDIRANSPEEARKYVVNYISSFYGWDYIVLPRRGVKCSA